MRPPLFKSLKPALNSGSILSSGTCPESGLCTTRMRQNEENPLPTGEGWVRGTSLKKLNGITCGTPHRPFGPPLPLGEGFSSLISKRPSPVGRGILIADFKTTLSRIPNAGAHPQCCVILKGYQLEAGNPMHDGIYDNICQVIVERRWCV